MKSYFLEDLSVGMSAETTNLVTEAVIQKFADVSGDTNPVHLDADFAAKTSFGERIAHGMLSGAYISAAIGTNLPGPGAIYISQSLSFKRPVKIGAEVVTRVEITAIDEAKARVTFATVCKVGGKAVVDGEAVVMVPRRSA
ncbi:MaoC family dehydratase [Caulobacter segnis]|uniref:MaoC family dehydratase n=1 Tax=Caulobacter segnis TaxID=88688 RepID=UPI00240F84EA|nr:MaoC family dehydratase [Caulobacter segnis]MDG2520093.1 MaoC family dehydratase [Caulobacter segnis]